MNRNARFWASMAVFQVLFGLAVFAVTREYYIGETDKVSTAATTTGQTSPAWPDGINQSDITALSSSTFSDLAFQDPADISRQADEFFSARQYEQAAALYQRLLAFSPENVDVLNNLGLTLHYLGRSDEALRRLNEGVAADPANQRIWLTLGFVNSQMGNSEQARTALTNAAQTGTDESIRQSANTMLESLP